MKANDLTSNEEKSIYIKITPNGPYLVYGEVPIDQEIIIPNADGNSWEYRKGEKFTSKLRPVALCRCGKSQKKPFCDGSHTHVNWNSKETASKEPILKGSVVIEGESLILTDNEEYCAFARFCDAKGQIWNLVRTAHTTEERNLVIREGGNCPAGRLIVWDKATEKAQEPHLDPSISILEDPGISVSGPIWVKGGIKIYSADGTMYEVRNRVTLCRCGESSNKPFCDGTHSSSHFQDEL